MTGVDNRDLDATMAGLLLERSDDDAVGLCFEDRRWTWRQVVDESLRRAATLRSVGSMEPPHIGVLLENVPEYLFWLGAAALTGAVVVGVNPTRRGEGLARDVRFTDCRLVVTDDRGGGLLAGLDLGLGPERVLVVGSGDQPAEAVGDAMPVTEVAASSDDLFLLLFTSGTTGAPKAVRCTQGRLAAIARRAAQLYDFRPDDVAYCPMPLFHGNALMALWAPAMAVGASVALTRRFSASGFLPDVRRHGATRFTYVGKALAYVLTTDERGDDADNTLRIGFGTEASSPDRAEFERRFGCALVEGYGSSEGGANITVTPDTPPGSLGRSDHDICIVDPATGRECPRARLDAGGRLLNIDEAVGEIVNRSGALGFEGYYKDATADAERVHDGWYFTGDLGYRDDSGFFYFAGRGGDRIRVDSENLAAAPIERVIERHPDIAAAAVYAVPDPRAGDAVMAAVEMRPERSFDPAGFAGFLARQPDLGTKWAPLFVRIVAAMPVTGTGKITKTGLSAQGWSCDDAVFWRPESRGQLEAPYRPLTEGDRGRLRRTFEDHGRLGLLEPAGVALDAGRRPVV
jgi:fatty-acyl-CoA synthase